MKTHCRQTSPEKLFSEKSMINLEDDNNHKSNEADHTPLRVNKSLREEDLKGLPKTKLHRALLKYKRDVHLC